MTTDLKSLVTFVEVSRRLSFAEAARALDMPPSTVTTRIKSLEAELGVRLFTRSTRKAALTVEGKDFAEHCERALAEVEAGREKLTRASEASGLVKVSIPSDFPKAQFAALVASFRREFPKISIEVILEDRLTTFVEDGVDLALRGGAPGGEGVYARRLADTPIVCVAPSNAQTPSMLPLLTPLGSRARHLPETPGVTTRSLEFALSLVAEGEACAYLPISICEYLIRKGQVVVIEGPMKIKKPLTLFLAYHDKKYQPKRVALFKDFLIASLSG